MIVLRMLCQVKLFFQHKFAECCDRNDLSLTKPFLDFEFFFSIAVLRAKGLLTKGKNGTNNCFATIEVGKEKYATSIKDSSPPMLEWHEECELFV